MIRNAVKLGLAAMFIAATAATPAITGAATASADPCGFYETSAYAYYNHCGETTVEIRVDRNWPIKDGTLCVDPGVTGLGTSKDINGAWYIGGAGCS